MQLGRERLMKRSGEGLASVRAKIASEALMNSVALPFRLIVHLRKALGRRLLAVQDTNWSRVIMNRETEHFVQQLPYRTFDALEVGGIKWDRFGFATYRSANFPAYDLCMSPLAIDAYDIVIAEQVLEHVLWPYRAVRNVWRMLKPGGLFVVTTPFLLPVHQVPVDCSRWTELGLKHLLVEGGFDAEQIVTASWGNRACVKANLKTWTPWIPWKHSLKNDPKFPVVVWAFAQKRLPSHDS